MSGLNGLGWPQMGKHTPGPWNTRSHIGRTQRPIWMVYSESAVKRLASVYPSKSNTMGTIVGLHVCENKHLEVEANAPLIARSPDMDAALRLVTETPQFYDMADDVQQAVRNAIGKGEA